MYMLVVYDAAPKRGAKLLKFLRQHLIWVQNSVFEGEVTESESAIILSRIKDIVNQEKDSIIYYLFDTDKYKERGIIGIEKNDTDSFI